MNPTSIALNLVEPLLITGHWAHLEADDERCYVEVGIVHSNGFHESAIHRFLVHADGHVVESHAGV
jgi:hypothetical protein